MFDRPSQYLSHACGRAIGVPSTVVIPTPRDEQTERYWRVVRSRVVSPPRVLYKYRRVDLAIRLLESAELWFSPPAAFRDPDDCSTNPIWHLHEAETENWLWTLIEDSLADPRKCPEMTSQRRRAQLRAERERLGGMTPEDRRVYLNKQREDLEDDGRKRFERARHRFADFRRRFRIWCGTEDPSSERMWTEFGDEGRGVVLGFDPARLESHWKRPFQQVFYTDQIPTFFNTRAWLRRTWFDLPRSPVMESDEFHKVYLWKREKFGFEREWRLTWLDVRGAPEKALGFKFPPRSLVQVVLGGAIRPEDAARIEMLARAVNDRVRIMRAT